MPGSSLVRVLATSFLSGEAVVDQVFARGSAILGRRWRWLRPLAQRYVEAFALPLRPRRREVVRFLLQDAGFRDARYKYGAAIGIEQWLAGPQRMRPAGAAAGWDIPAIESAGALARWLGLTSGELEWFADLKGLTQTANPLLRHYHYRVREKRSGGIRLIEIPKPRLKELQRRILAGILDKVPPHPAAHGFVKGRSIRSFAAPHAARRVVLRMDLRDFFPSLSGARIQTFFRTAGYPESVADLLGGIATNAVPRDVLRNAAFEARALFARPHLPQGAPTSPALANICAWRVDCRLAGLARSVSAAYTRYADDLAFSGDEEFERRVDRFSTHVAAVLAEEGFHVNHRKTRIMRQGVQQRLAGLAVNRHLNVTRASFDNLKAILTNCVRLGPAGQNREAHPAFRARLEGRVGFVESIHPEKGARLRELLGKIHWE